MTPIDEKRALRVIEQHLSRVAETLLAMREAGLAEDREVQLDFFFDAPNKKAAKALAACLKGKDCLSLSIERAPGFFSREYIVSGKTYPTPVTAEILAKWIPWMVVQGLAHDCEFDGFGAQI
jgi:hypothetical protein